MCSPAFIEILSSSSSPSLWLGAKSSSFSSAEPHSESPKSMLNNGQHQSASVSFLFPLARSFDLPLTSSSKFVFLANFLYGNGRCRLSMRKRLQLNGTLRSMRFETILCSSRVSVIDDDWEVSAIQRVPFAGLFPTPKPIRLLIADHLHLVRRTRDHLRRVPVQAREGDNVLARSPHLSPRPWFLLSLQRR